MPRHHDTRPAERLPTPDHESLLHDLRASLTVISANAQMLERWVASGRSCPPEVTLTLLEVITGSAQTMRDRLRRLEDDGA